LNWFLVPGALGAVLSLSLAIVSGVSAHGGVATLQLGSERINPGGTLELLGDMATEGSVEITLVAEADGSVLALGTVQADYDGHFQAFLAVPDELPNGSYVVRARAAIDEASAPIVIAGAQVAGEEGQLPGQDEALAGGIAAPAPGGSPAAAAVVTPRSSAPSQPSQPADLPVTLLVVAIVVTGAIFLGGLARARSRLGRPIDR
jgi:hypothetical protein